MKTREELGLPWDDEKVYENCMRVSCLPIERTKDVEVFIQTACNHHHELVSALEELKDEFKQKDVRWCQIRAKWIDEVLAKVKGGAE